MNHKNLLKSIIPTLIFGFYSSCNAAQPDDHAEMMALAVPALKKALEVVDTKVIDTLIVTTCAAYGSHIGEATSIRIMEKINDSMGIISRFRPQDRYEDDFGRYLGGITGYHMGKFIVHLRHKITDPLFPQLYDLAAASLNASKTLVENFVDRTSGYMCSKLRGATEYLNVYAQKKNT
ncbi:hypothetical protein [Candidatus Paracaedibacter symbiosus]|uniref:hypothetical protein n=1 Tax=Candidatus Paracaedibacter symbiosus TaxID=244582 RepID=UPI000509D807|nr:hypothetical protein [Candidatus Paracaedibacter symbiosus]